MKANNDNKASKMARKKLMTNPLYHKTRKTQKKTLEWIGMQKIVKLAWDG